MFNFLLLLFSLLTISSINLGHNGIVLGNFIVKNSAHRTKPNNFTSNVVCSKHYLITSVTFQEPFHGIVYSKGFPIEPCIVYGNGSKVIHIEMNIHQCGVRTFENQNGDPEHDVLLYVQHERNIQQVSDERVKVNCSPREVLLTGGMGKQRYHHHIQHHIHHDKLNNSSAKFSVRNLFGNSNIVVKQMNNHDFTLEDIAESIECRMDVMKGRLPFLKPVDGFVDIGQDITVLIKIKEIEGIASMLSKCYAHDGSHTVKQELTDADGCTIDSNILQNFNQIRSNATESKIYFTTFPAFKFPDRSNLHLQCTIIICNTTCPQFECNEKSRHIHRIVKRVSENNRRDIASIITKRIIASHNNNNNNITSNGRVLSEIGVSNSVGVSGSDSITSTNDDHNNISSFGDVFTDEVVSCLTSHTVILFVGLLFTALASTMIVACCLGAKVQELHQKLSNHQLTQYRRHHTDSNRILYYSPRQDMQSFSYDRMVDLTS